jgi:hypothetical protein
MTLDDTAADLDRMDIEYALITWPRSTGLGERLDSSRDPDGLPRHLVHAIAVLCRGIQRALDDTQHFNPGEAAELSRLTKELSHRAFRAAGLSN